MLGHRKQVLSLDCGFNNMGWSKKFFTGVGEGKLLFVKCGAKH